MVKHIFLTCGVLLSATAQTAFAKELEGMLVTQNNYVRIRSCDLKNSPYVISNYSNTRIMREENRAIAEPTESRGPLPRQWGFPKYIPEPPF